jgi:hypothetical protein
MAGSFRCSRSRTEAIAGCVPTNEMIEKKQVAVLQVDKL